MRVNPTALADAADNLANLGTAIEESNAVAAAPITSVFPAAADEVSAMISQLFNGHGEWWQTIAAEAEAFHQQFVQNLTSSWTAYLETELAVENELRSAVTQVELQTPITSLLSSLSGYVPVNPLTTLAGLMPTNLSSIALVLGGTTGPVVPQPLAKVLEGIYFPGVPTYSLWTPEQAWPFTPQLGSLTFDQSFAVGTQSLNSAIMTQLAAGNNVTVWTTSQSSVIATDEIRNLMAMGSPGVDKLSFILTGNPNTPNGGPFERFAGLYIPGLDVLFNGATPPASPYSTMIFTNQYDGVANFPQYPLNLVSDANALAGFAFGPHDYSDPTTQVANAIQLATSPGYTGATKYYETLTQNLPLVHPLRMLPQPYGNALADLLQPDLRVLSDMGYGSGEYADIPTPASLFELPNPFTIGPDLVKGTIQGPEAALVDLGFLPQSYYPMGSYPFSPVLDPGLNFPLPQSSVTGLSLLTGFEGALFALTGLEGSGLAPLA